MELSRAGSETRTRDAADLCLAEGTVMVSWSWTDYYMVSSRLFRYKKVNEGPLGFIWLVSPINIFINIYK